MYPVQCPCVVKLLSDIEELECQNLIKMSNCQEPYQGGAAIILTYTLSKSILSTF